MAGGSAVAALGAVTVEDGPGLTAAAAVFTPIRRTPEREREREEASFEFIYCPTG